MANAKGGALAVPEKGGAVAAYDYGTDAGAGFEGIRKEDLSIPFINILQAMSPEVESGSIEGAKAGMLFNTVTKELIDGDKGIVYQPVTIDSLVVEWTPRDKGGGLVAMHAPDADVVKAAQKVLLEKTGKKFGKMSSPAGNDLVPTHYVYGLTLDDEGESVEGFALMSFTSTKITPYKNWTTAMYSIKGRPPLFANRARIKSFKDKSEKGPFFNVAISPLKATWKDSLINPVTGGDMLKAAKDFIEMIQSGRAKADFEKSGGSAGGGDEGGDGRAPF